MAGSWLVAAVARGAEHAAGVVAAPVVAAVRAEEDVVAASAVLAGAGAPLDGLGLDLAGDHLGEERREVDGKVRLREIRSRFHRIPPKDDSYRSPGCCHSTWISSGWTYSRSRPIVSP